MLHEYGSLEVICNNTAKGTPTLNTKCFHMIYIRDAPVNKFINPNQDLYKLQ